MTCKMNITNVLIRRLLHIVLHFHICVGRNEDEIFVKPAARDEQLRFKRMYYYFNLFIVFLSPHPVASTGYIQHRCDMCMMKICREHNDFISSNFLKIYTI